MKVRLETLVSMLCILAGCGGAATQAPAEPAGVLNVVVSIVPQQYFVERIGGERISGTVMVPPGFSPATYEPKPEQLQALSEADAYARIRVPFEEAWMDRIVSANEDMLIVDECTGIERIGGKDPHIWLSPTLVKIQARNILNALVAIDQANKSVYEAGYKQFIIEIENLDAELKGIFAGKRKGMEFIVFHPSWGYFAGEYGLKQIPVEIEGKDPKPADLQRLIKHAKKLGVKVIFVQPQFSAASASVIAQAIGGQIAFADPLALNWPDNLRQVAAKFKAASR